MLGKVFVVGCGWQSRIESLQVLKILTFDLDLDCDNLNSIDMQKYVLLFYQFWCVHDQQSHGEEDDEQYEHDHYDHCLRAELL